MLVCSHTVGFIIGPVAIIDVTINMDESALAMGSVFSPLSSVFGLISPDLLAKAITEATLPLASVNSSRFKNVRRSLNPWLIRVIDVLGDRLACFLLRKILATAEHFCSDERNVATRVVAAPPRLQLHNMLEFLFEKRVVVNVAATDSETLGASFVTAAGSKPLSLLVHVELSVLSVFAHAV